MDKTLVAFSLGWGTIAYRTLERWLRYAGKEELGIVSTSGISPYFLTVQLKKPAVNELCQWIISKQNDEIEGRDLLGEAEAPQLQKYDEFVPPELLHKAFAGDCLDIGDMKEEVRGWR